jgi:hypothetical protein
MPANRTYRPPIHLGKANPTVEGKRGMNEYERGVVAEDD